MQALTEDEVRKRLDPDRVISAVTQRAANRIKTAP
jgi:hypothetical protein